ncbi:MAG: Gfo/Idh/MocA family protein, partial [Fimbriimonadales bacterium]
MDDLAELKNNGWTRRQFLARTGAVAAAGAAAPLMRFADASSWQGAAKSPNDKLVIGLIGCGGMGAANMRNLMNFPDVEVAALCDVDDNRMPNDINDVEKKYGRKPDVYKDYRKILDRKDIDAIIVGTPDHWHAMILIGACEAGKDAYCEKPMSHNIVEAVSMAGAVKQHKRIVQCGTWQRSTKEFTDAIDYVRAGKLGKIVLCRAWISDGFQAGHQKPSDPPKGVDYDMWVGPAAFLPYQSNRFHFNWRWFMNFGGGMSTDWGVHMMDIALLGMSKDQDLVMPVSVSAFGGNLAFPDDDRNAPDCMEAIYDFKNPDFTMHWSIGRDHPGKEGHGTEFVSADGRTLRVWRGGWKILDADGKELPKEESAPPPDHWRNFVDCVKTRTQPRAQLVWGAQTRGVGHLAKGALSARGTGLWASKREEIAGG